MPFVRPNNYTASTPIVAAEVRENHEALRAYVNAGAEPDDIADECVTSEQLQRGEYAFVTPDHRFMTGNEYSGFVDSDPTHETVHGISMKSTGADGTLWHPVIGKRFYVESEDSMAIVGFYLKIQPRRNIVSDDSGDSDDAWIFVDGERDTGTRLRYFAADSSAAAASDAGGEGPSRHREATATLLIAGLTPGWHTVELRVDPGLDFSQVFSRSISVELFEA